MTTKETTMEAMTWDEFREQAVARAGRHAIGGDLTGRLAYLALGLCGEAAEYARAVADDDPEECVSELGDVAWYLAMIEHATGERAAWPAAGGPSSAGGSALMTAAGAVAECVKRPMQGRDLPAERFRAALADVASALALAARYWTGSGDGMGAVYTANIAKTKARFGAGFTVAQARALDAEAKR